MWRILLFSEAWVWLLIARLMVRLLPFRWLAAFLDLPLIRQRRRDFSGTLRKDVRWAVRTAATFLPGETVCFPQGIAAHIMCRLRAIPTTLVYGAGISPEGRLKAHVWIQDQVQGVIGHSLAAEYMVIATFPAG